MLFFFMHWLMGGKHREHLTLHQVPQAGYGGLRSAQILSESDIARCRSLSGLADLILGKADGRALGKTERKAEMISVTLTTVIIWKHTV